MVMVVLVDEVIRLVLKLGILSIDQEKHSADVNHPTDSTTTQRQRVENPESIRVIKKYLNLEKKYRSFKNVWR